MYMCINTYMYVTTCTKVYLNISKYTCTLYICINMYMYMTTCTNVYLSVSQYKYTCTYV